MGYLTVYYQQKENLRSGDQSNQADIVSVFSFFTSNNSSTAVAVSDDSSNSSKTLNSGADNTSAQSDQSGQLAQAQSSKKITLLAVGDIMMHQNQIDSAYDKKTDSYNLSDYFKNINPYLKGGDIVYANLETPVAGGRFEIFRISKIQCTDGDFGRAEEKLFYSSFFVQ